MNRAALAVLLLMDSLLAGCASEPFMESTRAADGSFLRYRDGADYHRRKGYHPEDAEFVPGVLYPHLVRPGIDAEDVRFGILVGVVLGVTTLMGDATRRAVQQ